ncbi:HNH endonuclease signature motif containing protein [Streptomyces sp.]|uniref:HNH endonuclease n=1 Tax=Streptomyces sp. TaxID=1931 RepID=UPI002F95C1D0
MGEQAGMTRADRAESAWYRNLNLNSPCSYCGAPADTNDHLQAVVTGGTDHWWNLAACCKSCNSSKGAKELLEFLMYRLEGGMDDGALPA